MAFKKTTQAESFEAIPKDQLPNEDEQKKLATVKPDQKRS